MSESTTTIEVKDLPEASENGSSNRPIPNQPAPVSKIRPRARKRLMIAAGSVALCIACAFAWHYLAGFESTDDAQVDVHLYPVSARVSGYIEKVNVRDNQYVRRGGTLVEIDPTDYQVAVDRARAELENAEAAARALRIDVPITAIDTASQLQFSSSAVQNARAGVAAAQKEAAATHALLLEAEAENVKGQGDVNRYQLLLAKDEVPRQIFDHAYATAKSDSAAVAAAEANEAAAEQAVQQAASQLMESEAKLQAAKTGPQRVASTRARALSAAADVKQKQAALGQAQLNLTYTKIVAPVSGVVNKKVVVGMNVDPGEQLLTVVPLEEVWITANFKETQLRHMQPGQRVEVSVDSTGRTYTGRVDSVAGATGPLFSLLPPENATGNYVKIVQRLPVKIVLDPGENHDHQLRPGMNVEAKVFVR
ncbi:MAG TPA: HlyD family secretion protein [Candidatus Acidoferrales bacterium]|nr:HlyD family secretion protein [Candidatus Acidoferrales bacterium]